MSQPRSRRPAPAVPTPSALVSALLGSALLGPGAAAQAGSGGFQAGDLYLHTTAWTGSSSADGAVVRIDPATGTKSVLHALATSGPTTQGLAYDPWRDRLLFFGGFQPNSLELWSSDAAGNLQSLGFQTVSGGARGLLAPRGDGLVYLLEPGNTDALSYLDGQDQLHRLMDATGTQPWSFALPEVQIQNLLYVPSTNSLLFTRWSFSDPCPGIPNDVTALHRLDLSSDGSRVVAESCFWFDAVPSDWDGETRGLSLGPDGDPILVIGNGNGGSGQQARVARVDFGTDTASAFALTDFLGQQRIVGGCYSHALGKALVHDSVADVLRAYSGGESGPGTIVATGLSASGGSNERAYLVEIAAPGAGQELVGTPSALSVAQGGQQALQIDVGSALGGSVYLTLGTLSGTAPGQVINGQGVPLNPDPWFDFTATYPNQAPLGGSLGLLDPAGRGVTTLTLGTGLPPTVVGLVFHHAAVVLGPGFTVVHATNAASLELVP